jgi:hypothetical protein
MGLSRLSAVSPFVTCFRLATATYITTICYNRDTKYSRGSEWMASRIWDGHAYLISSP